MPSASELARKEAEAALVEQPSRPPFNITIDFGNHQAKFQMDAGSLMALNTAKEDGAIGRAIGEEIAPHAKTMFDAEERSNAAAS